MNKLYLLLRLKSNQINNNLNFNWQIKRDLFKISNTNRINYVLLEIVTKLFKPILSFFLVEAPALRLLP